MVADDSVVFDAVAFVCYKYVLSCPLIASHVENISDLSSSLHQHPKNNHTQYCCRNKYDTPSAKRYIPKGTKLLLPVLRPAVLFWQSVHSLLPVAFLSDAPTTKTMHGSPARALVNRCDKLRLD